MQYAWGLFRVPESTQITWTRTPGYPLLIALTGTIGPGGYFYTFKRLLAVQAFMAVAMPVLVYKILELYNPRIAFYGALFFILSLAPFIMSKMIMTEELYKFTTILIIYFLCRILKSESCSFTQLLPLTLSCLLLLLIRPGAMAIFLTIFAIFLVMRFKWWRAICANLAIPFACLAVMSFAMSLFNMLPDTDGKVGYAVKSHSKFSELELYDLYMNHADILLDENAGKEKAALKKVVAEFVNDMPEGWKDRAPVQYFKPYAGKPAAMLKKIYEEPARPYFALLRDAVYIYSNEGPDPKTKDLARGLIHRVTHEVYRDHPALFFEYLGRYMTAAIKTAGGGAAVLTYEIFAVDHAARLEAKNGPASARFLQILKDHLTYNPSVILSMTPKNSKKDFRKDPGALIDMRFVKNFDGDMFFFSWDIIDRYLGPIDTNRLYSQIIEEGIKNGWVEEDGFYLHFFKRGMYQLSLFYLNPFIRDGKVFGIFDSTHFSFDENVTQCVFPLGANGEEYVKELKGGMRLFDVIPIQLETAAPAETYRTPMDLVVHILWDSARFISEFIIFLGVIFCWRSRVVLPVLVLLMMIAQHSIVAAFMIGAQMRYVDQMQPMLILCACFIVIAVKDFIGRKKELPHER